MRVATPIGRYRGNFPLARLVKPRVDSDSFDTLSRPIPGASGRLAFAPPHRWRPWYPIPGPELRQKEVMTMFRLLTCAAVICVLLAPSFALGQGVLVVVDPDHHVRLPRHPIPLHRRPKSRRQWRQTQ